MGQNPNEKEEQAKKLYSEGMKLSDIAKEIGVPTGTVRCWKKRHHWEEKTSATLQEIRRNVAKEKNKVRGKEICREVEQIIDNEELSDKYKLFCLYYIRCFNPAKAYQKAFQCSYNSALTSAQQLLKKPAIQDAIAGLKRERFNREFFSEEDIFQKYIDIAFADITDYLEFGSKGAKFKDSKDVDGSIISEVKWGRAGTGIKLGDRMKALQWLSDHMELATEEQKARIAQMKAQTEKMQEEEEKDKPLEIVFRKASESQDAGGTENNASE